MRRSGTRLAPLTLIWLGTAIAASAQDIPATVRQRIRDNLLRARPDAAAARHDLEMQAPDGSWPDIPYERKDRSLWPPVEHLTRLETMALTEASAASPLHGDERLKSAIAQGLAFWVRRDPTSDNWWWNTIGMQQSLGPLLILSRDDLLAHDAATWQAACAQMGRSHVDKMTGANLTWEAQNLFTLGALRGDLQLMAAMSRLASAEVRVTPNEGVQPDDSFHQHGPQLNAGNYGLSFVPTAAHFALLVQGTPLQWPREKLEVLEHFQHGFQDWVLWHGFLDLSSCGRQVDQPNEQTNKARAIAGGGALLDGLLPAEKQRSAPQGDRYYWRSDFLVHRPGEWYVSVKTYSPLVLRTETKINSENYRGYHLCDGMTSILVRGDEYQNIQPVWNWRMLPGVTFKETAAPFPYGPKSAPEFNPCPFVGGASDGRIGVAAMDIRKENVEASKAWFCFPGGVVCLGTAIRCTGTEPVTTDINQCLLHGPVSALDGSGWHEAASGDVPPGVQAVWHDRVGYVRLAPDAWTLSAGPQTGSWALLRKEGVSPKKVTKDVFNLWVQEGASPTDAGYAYPLLPNADQAAVAAFMLRPTFQVLANDHDRQIVADAADEVIAAVLRRPGAVPAAASVPEFSVDRPCVVIARREEGGLRFYLSDPTQTQRRITITVHSRGSSGLDFPQGELAGSTATTYFGGGWKLTLTKS